MVKTRAPSPLAFSRKIAVETPEHVVLEFELAGIGSRAAAAIYDAAVVSLLLLLGGSAWGIGFGLPVTVQGWIGAVFVLVQFATGWGYFVLFEALANGRTPGKRRLGIRVVLDTGHPVTFSAAAVRNLIRLVDVQPIPTYLVGLLFVFFQTENKRLGDIVAGTIVVRDRPSDLGLAPPTTADQPEPMEAGPPKLSDDEFRLLSQVLERLDSLDHDVRRRFLASLERRFADRFPNRDPRPELFLASLYREEAHKRRGIMAVRGPGGTPSSGTGDRFIGLKQASWEEFRRRALSIEHGGLTRLSGKELIDFAAAYREVAADLARARTYQTDQRVLDYLGRVVSAGHNALYGVRGVQRISLRHLLLEQFPAAVYQARRYVLVACLIFVLPAVSGYFLIRERPATAYEILPDEMIARAEAGQRAIAAGRGYAQAPSPFLPFVATSIIANNVQVAFGAFAFGITAGVGTVLVLLFNGLFFGAVLGLFANYQLAGWLLTFVAGHGVLELTAIFVAGGAGLRIGHAIIAPGDLARRDALVVQGRTAIHLVGAAASLLLLAGLIEGFLSASGAPSALKLGVSAASAVLVVLYLVVGRMAEGAGHQPSTVSPM